MRTRASTDSVNNVLTYCKPGEPPRAVVPVSKRDMLLRLVHEELGHGVTTTESELKMLFHWPRLRATVTDFLRACEERGRRQRLLGRACILAGISCLCSPTPRSYDTALVLPCTQASGCRPRAIATQETVPKKLCC